MRLHTPAAGLLAVAVLPLALTACSSSTPQAAAPAPATTAAAPATPAAAPSATPSAAPAAADPNAGLLTGTQLKALLAPATAFATGFAIDAASTRDTGDTYQLPAVTEVPTPDCTRLGGTSWTEITGIAGVSFAENAYIDKNASAESAQEIDVYRDKTAQTVVGALGKLSLACPGYTDPQTNGKVTVAEKALPAVGDEAYVITLTSPAWKGGTTLVAARVGTAVVTVLASSGTDKGTATATKLAGQLATGLKGKA
ncbi:hypothetical protein GCM10010495_62110 [Kitasatospora herbaricolor]|uniref:hypothetical protein n=1 Tax=Kitasatospora herbaricolor TaxID=68217 RepID=UPI00174DB596|nr:hypothetical protein [Kitasatospora herbaricolor]MDQ0307476.1 hypothetical protein [Kitasatospora herbaricolor]GGV36574.1 hypothetical protein GCM10010495_62110 [Kitasatospora herbaricolor]